MSQCVIRFLSRNKLSVMSAIRRELPDAGLSLLTDDWEARQEDRGLGSPNDVARSESSRGSNARYGRYQCASLQSRRISAVKLAGGRSRSGVVRGRTGRVARNEGCMTDRRAEAIIGRASDGNSEDLSQKRCAEVGSAIGGDRATSRQGWTASTRPRLSSGEASSVQAVTMEAACGAARAQEAGSRKLLPGTLHLTKHEAPSTELGFKTGSPRRDPLTGASHLSSTYYILYYITISYLLYGIPHILPPCPHYSLELTPIPTGMK